MPIGGQVFGQLFLWLAYSQHIVCTLAHRVSFAFGSLRPVLSCGALTGLFYWMAAAHRVSFAFGSLRPVLSCGALTGLFYWTAAAHRVSFAFGSLHPVLGCGRLTACGVSQSLIQLSSIKGSMSSSAGSHRRLLSSSSDNQQAASCSSNVGWPDSMRHK